MSAREYIDQRLAAKARRLSQPCPMPRCPAGIGQECRTPNGWATHHKRRELAVANGGEVPVKPRRHRLTDAQAQRIEWAAEAGVYYAPDQYATLRGEATERSCADALERAGLVEQFDTTDAGERMFRLTPAGWDAYHTSPLVIRRFDESRHDEQCPCRRATSPAEQVEQVQAQPEVQAVQSDLATRWEATKRELQAAEVGAQFRLRPVLQEERGSRPPLGRIRGVTDIAEARAGRAARLTPTDGGAA